MFSRTRDINLSPIKQMEIRASKIPGVVSLAQGIPSFDTPEIIKQRAIAAVKEGKVAKYSLSPGIWELREVIEEKLAEDNMFYDFETEIIVTVGAIEAITSTLLAILETGDEVLLPSPTYTSYQESIKIAGGVPVFVDLIEENGWALDVPAFERAVTDKTKAILFCNPNNPTGTIYTAEQLLRLAEIARKHNLFILTDEVYKDFIYDRNNNFFSLAEIPEIRKFIIRIFSFSKAYAMTGWRLGFLHSDKEVTREILKIHDGLITCAPVISQYAALAALESAKKDVQYFCREYKKRRELICRRLDKLSSVFSYQKPNSSYFIFPKILTEPRDSWQFALKLLEEAKVAVVPGQAFGPNGEEHVRMSFGRSEEDINEAFDRMERYF